MTNDEILYQLEQLVKHMLYLLDQYDPDKGSEDLRDQGRQLAAEILSLITDAKQYH